MSLFWLQCPKPQKCYEVKYLNLQNFSVGVKLWEWNNFFVSVFFVYFLSIAKYDRAVLLVTLKPKKKKNLTQLKLFTSSTIVSKSKYINTAWGHMISL